MAANSAIKVRKTLDTTVGLVGSETEPVGEPEE